VTQEGRTVDAFTGHGEIDFASGAYRTVLQRAGQPAQLERRRTRGTLFIASLRGDSSRLPYWVAFPLTPAQQARLSPAPGADALTDPVSLLRVLSLTRAPAVPGGRAILRGVPTTRYTLRSDLASVLRESSASDNPPAAYSRVQARIEVWLDRQGRPRRVSEIFQGGAAPTGDSLRSVITFSGYGEPVRILAPAGARRSPRTASGGPRALATDPSDLYERLLFAGG
jgi:hypothetical protein